MIFKICNTFSEWVENFDSHRELQAATDMTPLFRASDEDDPQIGDVIQVEDDKKVAAFMAENEAAILVYGQLLETTEGNP